MIFRGSPDIRFVLIKGRLLKETDKFSNITLPKNLIYLLRNTFLENRGNSKNQNTLLRHKLVPDMPEFFIDNPDQIFVKLPCTHKHTHANIPKNSSLPFSGCFLFRPPHNTPALHQSHHPKLQQRTSPPYNRATGNHSTAEISSARQ